MAVEAEAVVQLLLAVLIGGLVGWQREMVHRPAGLRTHMLVAMSATFITIIAVQEFATQGARIIGAIVTGMGFLGAGTIFRDKDQVHGLTTAASLWTVAAVGIGIGTGYYELVLVAAVLILVILHLNKFEKSKHISKK